ncbi:hypothetical protein LTR59_011091 [Friedmanniomyces endolithicus]|nr:hypothetical protein LTR94_011907 [Friedmanniomyces endolithicus]KAK0785248.1 hypothetical protein LTR59_011091 [Friedmanniomyces endolithicus]KAK0790831.1 hypothetical protein LTR38_010448 [Friedmanniomyces endolithicus]KAK0840207.1 hypothetical protein LTR03_010720 [Friedmanniomyces endolithicus]
MNIERLINIDSRPSNNTGKSFETLPDQRVATELVEIATLQRKRSRESPPQCRTLMNAATMHCGPSWSYSHEDNLAIKRAMLYNQPGQLLHTLPKAGERSLQTSPTERTVPPLASTSTKWRTDEDASIVKLRRDGRKWKDIAEELPGRSAISCRLRYQNYLERRPQWDERKQDRLALLYDRYKEDMWSGIAAELGLPYRAVEAMHWPMGAEEMARRANRTVFSTSS